MGGCLHGQLEGVDALVRQARVEETAIHPQLPHHGTGTPWQREQPPIMCRVTVSLITVAGVYKFMSGKKARVDLGSRMYSAFSHRAMQTDTIVLHTAVRTTEIYANSLLSKRFCDTPRRTIKALIATIFRTGLTGRKHGTHERSKDIKNAIQLRDTLFTVLHL